MGWLNRILPRALKPVSRDVGFLYNAIKYKIQSYNKIPHSNPIFILGNQKSGTSVVAALLGKQTNLPTAIDFFYSGFFYSHFYNWKKQKISTQQFISLNRIEFSAAIIKEPNLSVFYKELKNAFPQSKFVIIIRNPFDNIRSILDRLGIAGNKENLENADKKKIFHAWHLLFDNNWIGGNKTHYIEVLAERWNIISEVYLNNSKDFLLIKYEDFVSNKQQTIDDVMQNLGLTKQNEITSELNRQFQPKGKNKHLSMEDYFGQNNLKRIEKICKENMNKLGY